ncbi:AraC family transcriptional regulator [Streptomyces sp. SID3343]|uniref:AraC family transcriptional regulator n=1 Tax=Streptomyces sp. SID3343 TaxID=2690260 RepID=UPI001368A74B|nr:AraC family transcriptional regulator [Streptomyces sp. SID3343]MYV97406.1 helix-turn-helix domain-containing protein [Streptomyces sp. SID3343]
MDALTSLLNGPRAQGAFLLRSMLSAPWSMRIQDEAPLTVVSMVRGQAWIALDRGEAIRLEAGDVAIVLGPDHYRVSDDPTSPPQIVIHPGQRCTTPDGRDLEKEMALGVRSWGNSPDAETIMLTGTYQLAGEVSRPLLEALPGLLVIRDDEWDCPLIPLLAAEIVKDEPGQDALLDRLLDLLLIAILRAWFSRSGTEAPGWYRAHRDPVVGQALCLIHNNPERPWTVASLATATGVSRASLARRFTDLIGEPPMAFLTTWRLSLAADLLCEPEATVGAVAEKVGYGSAFALSTAFKRVRGVSPREHRTLALRRERVGVDGTRHHVVGALG